MTTKRIVYRRPDGGVGVCHPMPGFVAEYTSRGMTEDAVIEAVKAKDVPLGSQNVQVVDVSAVPTDRTFREAWELPDGTTAPQVSMELARGIHLARIRVARNRKLSRLDADWMRATGQRQTATANTVESQRQALRDLPTTVNLDQFATPDALKAFWPAELADEPNEVR